MVTLENVCVCVCVCVCEGVSVYVCWLKSATSNHIQSLQITVWQPMSGYGDMASTSVRWKDTLQKRGRKQEYYKSVIQLYLYNVLFLLLLLLRIV